MPARGGNHEIAGRGRRYATMNAAAIVLDVDPLKDM